MLKLRERALGSAASSFRRVGLAGLFGVAAEASSCYKRPLRDLLARVLDEYGLIVLGWSGEWDTALVRAIQDCPARRYPTYWAAYHGHLSPTARGLLSGRAGHLISGLDLAGDESHGGCRRSGT